MRDEKWSVFLCCGSYEMAFGHTDASLGSQNPVARSKKAERPEARSQNSVARRRTGEGGGLWLLSAGFVILISCRPEVLKTSISGRKPITSSWVFTSLPKRSQIMSFMG